MKAAYQKDEALLADIDSARSAGRSRLWWLGQSGFLLHIGGKTILFDPYLSDSLTQKYAQTDKPHERMTERVIAPNRLSGIDVITCSHNHTDHLDAETLGNLFQANPRAMLVVPRANVSFVLERLGPVEARLAPVDAGETIRVAGIAIHGIPAAHNTVERDERGRCRFLGYVARLGDMAVYHSGDTLLHETLAVALKPHQVDLALVPINGNKPERRVAGNMRGSEAAKLASEIGAKLAIPHHFDMFAFNTEPPDEFVAECRRLGQPCRVLENGAGIDLTLTSYETSHRGH
jgi:L-ascorbate metabolism protein UlaG (beta-lactamase superfamily)